MTLNKTQIAVISGALLLIVLLFFANTKLPDNKERLKSSEHSNPNGAELMTLLESAKSSLSVNQKKVVTSLEEAVKTSPDKKTAYENIINLWDSLKQPVSAAYYMEQAAISSPTEKNWNEAGNRYYAATRFAKEAERPVLYSKARECFERTLQLNPKNVEAKINLGSCYVEGSSEPMKGIGILREVEKIDSNNVNLQLNFAFFSEKSGQWDKAIRRFEKVLRIQPDFIEAYLHLADAYKQMGNKEKAIESLETYKTKVEDVSVKTDMDEYIKQIKEEK